MSVRRPTHGEAVVGAVLAITAYIASAVVRRIGAEARHIPTEGVVRPVGPVYPIEHMAGIVLVLVIASTILGWFKRRGEVRNG